MNRLQKAALLNKVLRGQTAPLVAIKQADDRQAVVVHLLEYPKGWYSEEGKTSDVPVKLFYTDHDGSHIIDYLTYAQIRAKFKGTIALLPWNYRRKIVFKNQEGGNE